jgi:hypothetical protein
MANRFLSNIRINDAYTLPASDGTVGQVIGTDGAGNLSFVDQQGADGGATLIYQDNFTGDGTTTDFLLSQSVDNEVKTFVYIDGVYQDKSTYEIPQNTNSLEFSTAPPDGTSIEVVIFFSVAAEDYNQKLLFYGKASGAISKGDAVMFAGVQGDHFLIAKATQAAINSNPDYFLGLAAQDFLSNEFGYVTEFGRIDQIDTSGYTAGDILWFDGSTDGLISTSEPTPPNSKIQVAAVIRVHQNEGVIFVRPTWYHELGSSSNVDFSSLSDKDLLVYDNATGTWVNSKTLGDITTGNITTDGTVDGVDVSAFKDDYDTHTHTESEITDFGNYVTNVTHDAANTKLVVTTRDGLTQDLDISQYIDDTNLAYIQSGTLDGATGIATFTRDDATSFTVDLSALLDDTDTNDFVTGASFNTGDGVLTLTVQNQSNVTVDLDGRYLVNSSSGVNTTEPRFAYTTYTDPNPGTTRDAKFGDDGIAATEVYSSGLVIASGGNSSEWNTAYGWGNHATAGYLTSESDTLASVTSRGNTTTGDINVHGNILLTGTPTTTNQGRIIDFTGFDKEGTTDFTDRAYIRHTVNTGGYAGSVLEISSQNDSNDGIVFTTNPSSPLKHNGNDIITSATISSQSVSYASNAGLLNGWARAQSGGNVVLETASNGYLYINNWIHPANGTGLFYDSGPHFYESGATMYSSHTLRSGASLRAPIFYDENDTGHYIDIASSGLSANFNGNIEVYARSAAWAEGIRIRVPATNTWGGIRWTRDRGNYDGNWALGFKGAGDTTDDLVFWANNGGSEGDKARMDKAGNFTAVTSSRAPIFYDSNNTSYYVNPGGTSDLLGPLNIYNGDGAANPRLSVGRNSSQAFHFSVDDRIATITHQQDEGSGEHSMEFYINSPTAINDKVFRWKTNDGTLSYLDSAGFKSNVYYDRDNTNYYADPNSTSKLDAIVDTNGAGYVSRYHSGSDFTAGTLVTTNIPSSASSGASFIIEVTGKSYSGNPPFSFMAQGYLYNNGIINASGVNNGDLRLTYIKVMNLSGNLAFWWPRVSYWNSFEVRVRDAGGSSKNRVTGVGNSSEPTSATKVTQINLHKSIMYDHNTNSGEVYGTVFRDANDTSYYCDPAGDSIFNRIAARDGTDATGVSFRQPYEVISGEGWCTAHYAYNNNDGFLFLNRDTTGGTPRPTFHIGGKNNAGYAGYGSDDSIITLCRTNGTKSTGGTYAGTGLSNTSNYTNIIKTSSETVFNDAQGVHRFTGSVKATFLEINKTSQYGTGIDLTYSGSNSTGMIIRNNTGSSNQLGIAFYYSSAPQGPRGSITIGSSSVSYNTSSDYRLKENVVPMEGSLDRVDQLKPSRFNFIGEDNVVDGFLAHEAAEVVPEAVTGEKDAVDEEGNPVYQGIDQAKLVPLLVGAIQELKAEVEALKQQLNGIN